ncbi:MAG: hypothetical protein EOP38_27380, partial [Rubrivivax sp.]
MFKNSWFPSWVRPIPFVPGTGCASVVLLAASGFTHAQSADREVTAGALAPVIVTGESAWQSSWRSPGSVEVIDGEELRAGQLQINLSEGLG